MLNINFLNYIMVLLNFIYKCLPYILRIISFQWVGIFLHNFLYGFPFILFIIAVCVSMCCYTRVELLGELSGFGLTFCFVLLWSLLLCLLWHARSRFINPQGSSWLCCLLFHPGV